MTTQLRPPRLNKDVFVARLRELIDEGLDHDTIIERMNPCRGPGLTEQFTTEAVETITSAMAIEHEVRNAVMAQTHKDFVSRERYASEFDGVAASRRSHIRRTYPDVPIQDAKIVVLEAEQKQRRAMADQAAADWQSIQQRRIQLDTAAAEFPAAFPDFASWAPKPIT